MRKTKILHCFSSVNRGGAETLVMNIFRAIDRNKYEFHFLVHDQLYGDYYDEIIKLGGKVHMISGPNLSRLGHYKKNLRKLFVSEKFDVIHSHLQHFSGIILSEARRYNIPVRISHSHSIHDGYSDSAMRNIYRKIMQRKILKNATHMLGCSYNACKALFGKTPDEDEKIMYFPNALDLEKFHQSHMKYEVKEALGLKPDSVVIGHVGRFSEQKNHKFLIDIFHQYNKFNSNSILLLVGTGPLKSEIEKYVKEMQLNENVKFLGVRDDIPFILQSFDVFVFPSLYEGLGNVLVEAQLSGVTCLASSMVPREADLGVGLFEQLDLTDPGVWVKKIKHLIQHRNNDIDIDDIKIAARNKGYDINVCVDNYEKLIKENVR